MAASHAAGLHTQHAAAAPTAVSPGVPVYSSAGGGLSCAPFALQQVAAPAYSSTAGPVNLMPCASAPPHGVPVSAGMPLLCPQHMLVKDPALFPAHAVLPADVMMGAANAAAGGTQSARLQELQQQMVVINAHLTTLKMQLGMFSA